MTDLPKLHYFPIAGRAEAIRLAAVLGNVRFEETTINFPDWPTKKSEFPFGAIPVWEEPGKPAFLPQSNAILRFVGKQAGLYPTDLWDAAQVDAVLDALEEIGSSLGPSLREKDEEKKLEMRKVLSSTTLPAWFSQLDAHLAKLGDSYAVGSALTIADLKLAVLVNWFKGGVLDGIPADLTDAYPRISKIHQLVQSDERVKAYYAAKSNK